MGEGVIGDTPLSVMASRAPAVLKNGIKMDGKSAIRGGESDA